MTIRTFIKTFVREQDFLDLAIVNTGRVHHFGGLGFKKGPQKRVFRGILGLYISFHTFFQVHIRNLTFSVKMRRVAKVNRGFR